MLKAVIFDLNGVFIKSKLLSDRFRKDFAVNSKEVIEALAKIMPIVRKPNAPSCYRLFKSYLKSWNLTLSEKEFFDYWFSEETVVQNVVKYASELRKKGIKVFILSNNFKERTAYYRKHFPEIFSSVDIAYFSCETGFIKPDEKAFRKIMADNHLKPEEILYFDDSDHNVNAARKIGINAEKYAGLAAVKKKISTL